jgi:hypothetical protein
LESLLQNGKNPNITDKTDLFTMQDKKSVSETAPEKMKMDM